MNPKEAVSTMALTRAVELCVLKGGDGWSCHVMQYPDKRVAFRADADIDADGSPHAYHPRNIGLDDIRNAGRPGDWYGVVTDRHGTPVVQTPADPAPGYYISATAYHRPGKSLADPRCYLNSEEIPFVVIENYIRRRARGIVLGCKAMVTNTLNNKSTVAIVGDMGPLAKIGEISIACAKAIGVNPDPKRGGTSDNVIFYELWPDTPGQFAQEVFELIPA